FTDPGADNPWTVEVNWGDASATTTFTVSVTGTIPAKSHTYADNGTYTVQVKVTDKDGASDTKSFTVTVANLAPVVSAPANQSADEATAKPFDLGSFSDAGVNDSTWAVDVIWGDGSAHTTFSTTAQGALVTQTHVYTDNDTYTVTVKVTDKDSDS